ncbi:hypothetical protein F4814DRAFT_447700 [Daldinia grandis]|nr:hypothetical protein F4814DRAFT_447700 [Daldinia grandis]
MACPIRLSRDQAAPDILEIELQELNQDGTLIQTPHVTLPLYSEIDFYPEANLNPLVEASAQPIPARPVVNPATPPPAYPLNQGEYQRLRREIRRKVGYRLLPFVIIFCFLIQLDYLLFIHEQPYFEQVLGFTESQYKGVALTREIIHLIWQVPSNLFLSILPRPMEYLCAVLFAWGVIQLYLQYVNSVIEAHVFYLTLVYEKKRGRKGFPNGCDMAAHLFFHRRIRFYTQYRQYARWYPYGTLYLLNDIRTYRHGHGMYMLHDITQPPSIDSLALGDRTFNIHIPLGRSLWMASPGGIRKRAKLEICFALICFFISAIASGFGNLRHLTSMDMLLKTTGNVGEIRKGTMIAVVCFLWCMLSWFGSFCADLAKHRNRIIQGSLFVVLLSNILAFSLMMYPPASLVPKMVAKLLFTAFIFGLPTASFIVSITLTWILNCVPWNRPKRAICIAIATSCMSLANVYALLGPQVTSNLEANSENIYSSRILLGGVLFFCVGTAATTWALHMLLKQANSWMSRHRGGWEPPPITQWGAQTLDEEFRDKDHTFRFPE